MRPPAYLVLGLTVFANRAAFADADDASLIEKGIQLRREHRDAEALELFRRANDKNPTPRARAQIAFAEQALGQWVDAERDLRAAMATASDPWIASRGDALRTSLEAIGKHLATLTVTANIANGEVILNGARAGDLPLKKERVPAGSLRIDVRAKGYEPAFRTIELAAGAMVTEEFWMKENRAAIATVEPSSAVAANEPSAPRVDRAALVVSSSTPVSSGDTIRRNVAWGALGAAGAFLGAAVVAQIVHEDRASKYNDDARCFYGQLSRDQRCGTYRGQAETAQTLANIGFVAAGAFGIGAATLLLLQQEAPKSPAASVRVDVGVLRLDVAGTF